MTVRLTDTTRNAGLASITTEISTSGLLRIYDGTQPTAVATALGAQTLLAELPLSATAAGAPSSGVWTASAITDEASAIQAEDHREILQADVVKYLIKGALHERRIDRADGSHARRC